MRQMNLRMFALLGAAALAGCQQGEQAGKEAANQSAPASERQASASGGSAQTTPTSTIGAAIGGSAEHSSLMQALKTAGLGDTLAGAGPYTVFAPTNAAFQKLPAGTTEGLMRPEAKAQLTGLLTYHVVPGLVTSKDLVASIQRGGGKAQLATIAGGTLTATQANGGIVVTDAKGGQARVSNADMLQSNGVIHSVDAVLMPQA